MGILVKAYLGFGVHITDEQFDQLPWTVTPQDKEDGEHSDEPKPDFETWVTKVNGLVDPSAHITDREAEWEQWYESDPANKEAMSAFWESQREAVENCPIGFVDINTGDDYNPCVIVVVKSSMSHADWGEPRPAVTNVNPHDLVAATAFCAEHGIPFDIPQWILVAEYGG